MKRTTIMIHAMLGTLMTTAVLVAGGEPMYEMTRSSIDGGGVMRSTGGVLVSLLDNEIFSACLLGPDGGIDASPCPCFDVDDDGDITLNDNGQLQARFTGQ